MYVVREGKKRGRGSYVRTVVLFDGYVMYCGTRKQRKATQYETYEEARKVADVIESERQTISLVKPKHRVVKLLKEAT